MIGRAPAPLVYYSPLRLLVCVICIYWGYYLSENHTRWRVTRTFRVHFGGNANASRRTSTVKLSMSSDGPSPPPPGASSFWDEKYSDQDVFMYGTDPNDFLKETLPTLNLPSGANCLLMADGEGRNGVFMAQQGCKVTSVDISKEGLNKAEALSKEKGVVVTTVLADLGEFDFGTEQWDCIVGIFCHLPPPVRTRVLEAIPPSLKVGGAFVLECYTPDQLKYKTGGPPSAALFYSSKILSEAMDGTLAIERNEELVREVVEGTLHTGTAAVVQFVGRK
jgi:2-polyprenyl-3-methyl-5-hydroxy-6-metoxy-1,4-benzoquinol methylase